MNTIILPVLHNSGHSESRITDINMSLEDYNGLFITERIAAQNLRHRMSEPGYVSDWHIAGDPTLIIIRAGTLRIGLQGGECRDFTCGDMFIAQDYMESSQTFNPAQHGHTAKLIGDEPLLAVHIKLAERVAISAYITGN